MSNDYQRAKPGFYPGYSVMSQQKTWDEATRHTIDDRLNRVPPIRFFSADEAMLMEAIAACLVPQDDRRPERRIPIVPFIDERLFTNKIAGFRYEDMPPDQLAYRWMLQAIATMSIERFGSAFIACTRLQQEALLKSIHENEPDPPHPNWERMNVSRAWALLLEDCAGVYYSHPWAWDEIGFGGPAYPRGYMRLEGGLPEPWEVEEVRYDFRPPYESLSFEAETGEQHGHTQGGTH